MSFTLIIICLGVFIAIAVIAGIAASLSGAGLDQDNAELTPFVKKPYVFDVVSELNLYRLLNELYGDRFYIFPQVGYSHLIDLKPGADRKYRNRFDKKSADFVLCDKERAIARLVIELDGSSHQTEKRIARDEKVDGWMREIKLPIVHLNPKEMSADVVRKAIDSALV